MTNQPNWTMRAKDGGAIARVPETMRPQILPTMRVSRNGVECVINQSEFNPDTDERIVDKKKPAMKAAAEPAPTKASKRPARRKV